MKRFDYKVIVVATSYALEKELNRLGANGWEAFGLQVHNYAGSRQAITAYLKREN